MARVVAVCGMPGQKRRICRINGNQWLPSFFLMGDMIRLEVKTRGLEESPEILELSPQSCGKNSVMMFWQ
ncbi:MAG: hypothetical protein CM15mP8_4140 [Methanobacteriota archaeon]|nr:MAG: hypothetical protein CM15mP8_4140 [Euryarchaeota archaeon]